ncbi:Cdc43p [Saccharomyces cerevisiae EC1118]|uniref:Geranylgeranyl transferase type-1 subunit beta n=1 Tax=Saccharomyces cerevisiae (strain Lalvin EC1118 / Prise de mousse) TaxID=643680 RepID=C8Z896_YEAS8|nr:Cdc43p [Saccharomyces cerevisiae EC1118]
MCQATNGPSRVVTKKHRKFFERHLQLLPSSHQGHDVNRMAIIFYSISGLSIFDVNVSAKYGDHLGWMRKHYIKTVLDDTENTAISGFVGSLVMNIPHATTINLPNTLFALLSMIMLRDYEYFETILDKRSLARFVSKCQRPDRGSFVSCLDYKTNCGSSVDSDDLRFCYIAVAILYICGCRSKEDFDEYIDTEKLLGYIMSQQCYNGAFGAHNEPHSGYTSCALSTLALLSSLEKLSDKFKEDTITWLLHRQVSSHGCMKFESELNASYEQSDDGGFQGRENKFADTCYAFWCLNSLHLLTKDWKMLCQTELVTNYLLDRTQKTLTGGFSKNDEEDADLYHSCLGSAALALIEGKFNGELCIPQEIFNDFSKRCCF